MGIGLVDPFIYSKFVLTKRVRSVTRPESVDVTKASKNNVGLKTDLFYTKGLHR